AAVAGAVHDPRARALYEELAAAVAGGEVAPALTAALQRGLEMSLAPCRDGAAALGGGIQPGPGGPRRPAYRRARGERPGSRRLPAAARHRPLPGDPRGEPRRGRGHRAGRRDLVARSVSSHANRAVRPRSWQGVADEA